MFAVVVASQINYLYADRTSADRVAARTPGATVRQIAPCPGSGVYEGHTLRYDPGEVVEHRARTEVPA